MNIEQYKILCRALDRCDQGLVKLERKTNIAVIKGSSASSLYADLTEQKENLENLRLQLSQTMRILGVKL